MNGTTYYYKVSALNANGVGPPSGQAQATPTAVVPPSAPLPTLDDFNRGLREPALRRRALVERGLGRRGGPLRPLDLARLLDHDDLHGLAQPPPPSTGPDSEVWTRLSVLPGNDNQLRLYARLQQPGSSTYDGYMLRTTQLSGTDQVALERVDNGTIVTLLTINQELVAGDLLLLRVQGQVLEAWRNNGSWSRIGVVADATYGGAGYSGSAYAARPAAPTTSGRARWELRRPARRHLRAPPEPSPRAFSSTRIDLSWGASHRRLGHRRAVPDRALLGLALHLRSGRHRRRSHDELLGHGAEPLDRLLLQGARSGRGRRPTSAPTRTPRLRDPVAARPAERAAPHPGQLRRRLRKPALRPRALVERGLRRRGGPVRPLGLACLLDRDDLHRLAEVRPSTAPTARSTRGSRCCPATRTSSACTRACSSRAPRPTTATCCARPSSRGPTRSRSSGSTTAPSSPCSRSTRSSSPATSCSCASRGRCSRPGAIGLLVADLGSSPTRPTALLATSASAYAGRPAAPTTSGRARWELRRPARHDTSERPRNPHRERLQLDPDRPRLGSGHRQLGHRRAVPDRALLGLALHLRSDRHRRRSHDQLLEHGPKPLDRLLLPGARSGRGRRPQHRPLLEHGDCDDPGPARHDTSERPRNPHRERLELDPDRPRLAGGTDNVGVDAVPDRALPGASCSNFAEIAPGRRRHGRASMPRPPTGTACAPRTAQNRGLLEHRDCDDPRPARHDASERPRNPHRERLQLDPDRPLLAAATDDSGPSRST